MARKPCCVGKGLKKGAWTVEEDKKLISYIHEHGEGGWRDFPQKAGLERCGKSCRLRWTNYLKPDIKRGDFSDEEERIIIMLHASRGNKWSHIARHLPKRTDNEIKNYWNTHLKRRLIDQGIDPVTHKPLASNPNPGTPKTSEIQDEDEDGDGTNQSNPDEESQSGSMSPKSIQPSSSSSNLPEISSIGETLRPDASLAYKKRCFKSTSSTSRVLNKVASKVSSIGSILSASIDGTWINSTPLLSSSLDDDFSETSQFHVDELDPFLQPSEELFDRMEEDIAMNIDLNICEYDFSQFLDDEETENLGGYTQNLLMADVSSTSVDGDNTMPDLTDWSNYLVDDVNQDYDFENFLV